MTATVRTSDEAQAQAAAHRTPVDVSALVPLLAASGEMAALAERLRTARGERGVGSALRHVTYAALPRGAKAALAAALAVASGERLLWIARDAEAADRAADELRAWLGDESGVAALEPRTALPYERSELVRDETAARVAALAEWHRSDGPRILVASVQALLQHTIGPDDLPEQPLLLRAAARVPQRRLIEELVDLGYENVPEVGGRGEFTHRGGIVDIFPSGQRLPVRVEFFGDEIESLRAFDPATQRTVAPAAEVPILPASEFRLPRGGVEALRETVAALARRLPEPITADLARLEASASAPVGERGVLSGIEPGDAAEIWAGILAPTAALEHVGDAIWVVDEPRAVLSSADFLWQQERDRRRELESAEELPKGWPPGYLQRRDFQSALLAARTLELTEDPSHRDAPPGGNPFGWHEPAVPPALSGALPDTIRRWRSEGARVVIASDQAARLAEILADVDITAAPVHAIGETPGPGTISLVERSLGGGFAGGPDGLVVVTDHELFGTVRVRRPRALRRVVPRDILERLAPGDIVVHVDHGIARYDGIVRRAIRAGADGRSDTLGRTTLERDYLDLVFAGQDRIYLPVEQIGRISRFSGAEHPQLSKLGGTEWVRTKARVKRAVDDLAEELLELYAARTAAEGHAFLPDTPWQGELEASFPYEETPDQLKAAADVKADMEQQRPMDRLVVGDVGYGKTEVALRAAFKAMQDGTQVAVLVPTTVLAQQHFRTFSERLAAFPLSVRVLSRFVPREQQQHTLAGLRDGSVDLVVGTHRLLQKDVAFKDLGLVVVDEEQRFGVAHKERLKRLRREVDVLTLSATPIPRTLNFALSGIRDMSVIETPPEDRLPIQTRVAEASAGLVRDAILRELDRGGQVFYVHNRVETIEKAAEDLRRLLPSARIVVGHGQMAEGQLERVMLQFSSGDHDVLVCTTIIESGLDIPNANTIVIDRADTLGLAQLYQLRGRVGRSDRRAYCYLLYRRRERLSDVARKRLQAIFNASELGAGFQIALSDLEIRGAGNILGAQQSGHIAAVGFDLYNRLLAEAVEERKARREGREPRIERLPATIDLPVDAFLPDDYVPDEAQKLELYRRLGRVGSVESLGAIRSELIDRFGPLPAPVDRLLQVVRVRIDAEEAGIASLSQEDGTLVVRLGTLSRYEALQALGVVQPGRPVRDLADNVTLGSNQIRLRPVRGKSTWATARQVIERLADTRAGRVGVGR
jgi:transcription-repair coupling factor (superfamily II helicase)